MEEKELGGEVAKCVAASPKNGMKGRKRVNGGAESTKSQENKGGSERRTNAWTVSGIFGMCTSTDI